MYFTPQHAGHKRWYIFYFSQFKKPQFESSLLWPVKSLKTGLWKVFHLPFGLHEPLMGLQGLSWTRLRPRLGGRLSTQPTALLQVQYLLPLNQTQSWGPSRVSWGVQSSGLPGPIPGPASSEEPHQRSHFLVELRPLP